MRKLAMILLVTGALVAVPLVPAAAAPSPFTGSWTAVDTDGSDMRMAIGGGSAPRVLLVDDGASVCELDPEVVPTIAARVTGRGSIAGDTLTVDLAVYCLARPTYFLQVFGGAQFTYDAGTDTLVDGFGVIWHRAGS